MDTRRLDLGLADDVVAQSFGEPGQRTFRLLVTLPSGTLSVWLEKQQMLMLSAAIQELLEQTPSGQGIVVQSPDYPALSGEMEVKAGSLSIGYQSSSHGYVLEAGDFISSFDLDHIRFTASRQHLHTVRDQIEEIGRGGRPRCSLCGTPLTGGPHFCPESNGHTPVSGEA